MEGGSSRPAGQGDAGGDLPVGDWRSQLQPEARKRIVNKITETLERHLPIPSVELNELKKIAVRFEEKIYTAATSQSNYLRIIYLKMLSMETKTQNPAAINQPSLNPAGGNQSSIDPASLGIQSQVGNQGQSLPIGNQSSSQQLQLPQNLPNNAPGTSVQDSASLPTQMSTISGIPQCALPNSGQTSGLQKMSTISQTSVNSGATSNNYAAAQGQMQGRQQPQASMQQQSQNQLMYEQQIGQQILEQKLQHASLLQPHIQQQQSSLLQQTPLQFSQQPLMQMPSSILASQANVQQSQPTMMQTGLQSSLQQNQLSSASLDSTAQTGNAGVVDWQEEIYHKIKSMKELYFAELNELYQKLLLKFQQCESQNLLPHAKLTEQIEKMKCIKVMLERSISFLQIPKSSIQPALKEKVPLYEKQICYFVATNSKLRNIPPQSQFQPPGGHPQSTPQQQSSQVSQLQQHASLVNQMQQMSRQGSVTSMPQASASSLPNGSMRVSTLGVPTAPQNIGSTLQSSPNVGQIQGNAFGSLQMASMSSAQQSGVGTLQNVMTTPPHTSMNTLPPSSVNSLQTNSNIFQQQHLKLQQENYQMKQMLFQQMLFQQQQKQQLLQQQLLQQLLQLQMQQSIAELPVHQMSQLHRMNEEIKMQQGAGIKPELYQQLFQANAPHAYYHLQLKTGTTFPISSQNIPASSPQISQHSSPQVDQHGQHGLLSSLSYTGTPLQSASSPFVIPSPSTPIAPSPITTDSEKPLSGNASLSTTVNMVQQQTTLTAAQPQSIAVGTPGISASTLLAEFTNSEANLPNVSRNAGESNTTEGPLERLIKVQMTRMKAQAGVKNNMRGLNKSIIQQVSNHVVHVALSALFCFFFVYLWSNFPHG